MKIQHQNKNKKRVFIACIAVVILLAGLATYLFAFKGTFFGWNPIIKTTHNYGDVPTSDQIKAGEAIEQQTDEASHSGENPNAVGSERPPASTPDPNGGKAIVAIRISSVNQNDGLLQIRTLISSIISSGTCALVLQNGSSVITKTAEVQALPSSATCKGFDIPLSDVPDGVWRATLTFENATLKGSETKDITVI
ncbi:MAG TPA: hypothetical protein VFZ58_03035 [Candidatus Saccharimonadales bacterium]